MTEVQPRGFHARDGWYFRRGDDGDVQILAPDSSAASQVVTLDANTWASIVASVRAGGETADSWQRALAFHAGD